MQKPRIDILQTEILSKDWSVLKKLTYRYTHPDGNSEIHVREAYDRGDGMTALLVNKSKGSVILTQQFRIPTFLNGNKSGLMIEACAGKLGNEPPEEGMKREIEEETGYRVPNLEKVFSVYMSPGSVTELIHFYIAQVSDEMQVSPGGGLESENENIMVLEIPFEKAFKMIGHEIVDAKTIMLLQYFILNQ
jgi:GDP-mannose pyrophosphatase NudK